MPQTACNAIWLGHTWIEDYHNEDEIKDLAVKLKSHAINCLYVHTTPLTSEGDFDTSRASYLKYFLETYRKSHSDATIYAWMGIVTTSQEEPSIGTKFDLSDYALMQKTEQTAFMLVDDYDFDGVQLDIEPVQSGSKDYLISLSGLHEGLKARAKKLSVAVFFLADDKRVEKAEQEDKPLLWSWLPDYYDTVSLFADQLVVMHYNMGFEDSQAFADSVVKHLENLQQARANGAAVLMGLPTYTYAYTEAENLQAGLQGIEQAREKGFTGDGVAIYAEWTTDASEWQAFADFIDE